MTIAELHTTHVDTPVEASTRTTDRQLRIVRNVDAAYDAAIARAERNARVRMACDIAIVALMAVVAVSLLIARAAI